MEVEIALFILDLKNFRQSISRSDNSFVDVPPTREKESHKMLAIFCRTASELDFAHFWHSGCGTKPLKTLISVGWHKTFLHVQALDSGPSNAQKCRHGLH
jgi:hypothetical protein